MTFGDTLRFATRAALGYPLRTALLVVAISVGVAAVVILTSLGDGARRYVVGQFTSMGSNIIIVLQGRTETGGLNPGSFLNTTRDLTLDDASAILRSPLVRRAAPMSVGTSEVAANSRLREVLVLGTTADFAAIRYFSLSQGRFLPDQDWRRVGTVAVIGETIRAELFGSEPAVGQTIRLGDRRLQVIGVMSPSGQGLGTNTDELVIVPVATALALFNTASLLRIMVETHDRDAIEPGKNQIENILRSRHDGELDVTLITQDAMLSTFDRILGTLTLAVAGIGAISLVVAGVLVMNVMLVAVTQRTAEIGLLKALGASGGDIIQVFLAEATLLSFAGAMVGYGFGQIGAWIIRLTWPVLPAWPPAWAVGAALAMALGSGLIFGVMPARRAAALDPILALARR